MYDKINAEFWKQKTNPNLQQPNLVKTLTSEQRVSQRNNTPENFTSLEIDLVTNIAIFNR
jgi:hypothetical protein